MKVTVEGTASEIKEVLGTLPKDADVTTKETAAPKVTESPKATESPRATESKRATHTFHVGDVVRVIKDGSHGFDIGDKLRIYFVEDATYTQPYQAEYLDGRRIGRDWLFDSEIEATPKPEPKKKEDGTTKSNRKRAKLIKDAQADLKDLQETVGDYHSHKDKANHLYNAWLSQVIFKVDRDNRKIVAYAVGSIHGNKLSNDRGVAKCAPDEVFNIHIGKIIAAYRLYGLPVPAKYLYAVQPDDFAKGSIVKASYNSKEIKVYAVRPTHRESSGFEFAAPKTGFTYLTKEGFEWWAQIDGYRVVDDSQAKY